MGNIEATFECARCKEPGLQPNEYTRPIGELGGRDEEGRPICQECVDAAEAEYDEEWYEEYDFDHWDDDEDDWDDDD